MYSIPNENFLHADANYDEPLSMCVCFACEWFMLFLLFSIETAIAAAAVSTKDSSKSKICGVNVRAKMNVFQFSFPFLLPNVSVLFSVHHLARGENRKKNVSLCIWKATRMMPQNK